MERNPKLLRRLMGRAISRGHAFARDDRGVTVIEFAILALPFFTIIFAILETAMVFFAGQVLDSAVEDASRMIRTGRAQGLDYQLEDFRELMCGYTFKLFDCDEIKIKVAKIDKFTSTQTTGSIQTCTETECEWAEDVEDYTPGGARDVVQVFAYYRWPLVIQLPYFNLKNQPDNYRLLGATRVFRNEPF